MWLLMQQQDSQRSSSVNTIQPPQVHHRNWPGSVTVVTQLNFTQNTLTNTHTELR